ncbi:ADP-ribose pyrophosphatase [Vibrio chagasii]|nr:ADP-ribose pyrophosphatase [Vibrio chagasii]
MQHKIITEENKYSSFLKLDLITTEVKYDFGKEHQLKRYLVKGKDAASVLLYDTKNDLALMVEQFRIGMVYQESAKSLECPAGLVDNGESAKQTIIRECTEETGMIITEDMLHQVTDLAYMSAGTSNSRISVFICECDLSNAKEGIHGEDADEIIHTRLVSYSGLIEKLKNNEIKHVTQVAALQHSLLLANGLI